MLFITLTLILLLIHYELTSSVCSNSQYLSIDERYGRSGNNLIQFTRALWLSQQLNRTFILPDWLVAELKPFNLSAFPPMFCISSGTASTSNIRNTLLLRGEDVYFGHTLFIDPQARYGSLSSLLPVLSETTMLGLARHAHLVSALLWKGTNRHLHRAVSDIFQHELMNRPDFMAIHLRSFEGQCHKLLQAATSSEHFLPEEHYLREALCSMSHSAIARLIKATNLTSTSLVYIATDIHPRRLRHMLPPLSSGTYVFSDAAYESMIRRLTARGNDDFTATAAELRAPGYRKFVDMLLCIRSGVFVMNPASTFSWEIFVARVSHVFVTISLILYLF